MKSNSAKILTPNFGRRTTKPLVDDPNRDYTIISTSAMRRAQILQEETLRINGVHIDVLQLAKELSIAD